MRKSTRKDNMVDIIRNSSIASLNMIPCIGGAVSFMLDKYIPDNNVRLIHECLNEIQESIDELPTKIYNSNRKMNSIKKLNIIDWLLMKIKYILDDDIGKILFDLESGHIYVSKINSINNISIVGFSDMKCDIKLEIDLDVNIWGAIDDFLSSNYLCDFICKEDMNDTDLDIDISYQERMEIIISILYNNNDLLYIPKEIDIACSSMRLDSIFEFESIRLCVY